MPVRVLSRVYRGQFVAGLRAAQARGHLPGFTDVVVFERWLASLYAHAWVVHAKPPAPTPEVVLKYLARYVSRVALAESRLLRLADGQVTFTYKDYARGGQQREMTLDAVEFLRRWTEHVLPQGLVAARHYGLLANRGREKKLAWCRRLLWPLVYVVVGVTAVSEPLAACPRCGGRQRAAGDVAPAWALANTHAVVEVDST